MINHEVPAKPAHEVSVPYVSDPPQVRTGREFNHREGWLTEDRSFLKNKWENFKELREKNRREAIEYLAERDYPFCVVCDKPEIRIYSFDIDHIDHNKRHNQRWNLCLKHHDCNSHTQNKSEPIPAPSPVRESEGVFREGPAGEEGGKETVVGLPWSSREGEKSERMVAKFRNWIMDSVKGPFRGNRIIKLNDLIYMAPTGVGEGRAKTYRDYVRELKFDMLEIRKVEGTWMVRNRAFGDEQQKLDLGFSQVECPFHKVKLRRRIRNLSYQEPVCPECGMTESEVVSPKETSPSGSM